jgi:hypothetical protein
VLMSGVAGARFGPSLEMMATATLMLGLRP